MSNKNWEALLPYLRRERDLFQLQEILNYDIATTTPEKEIERESLLLADLSNQSAALKKEEGFIKALDAVLADDSLTPMQHKVAFLEREQTKLFEKMPLEEYAEYARLLQKSNETWRKYKLENNFAAWLPHWEKMVEAHKKFLAYQKKDGMSLYEVGIDLFEKGMNEKKLDEVFGPLKEFLIKKIPEVLKKEEKIAYPKINPVDALTQSRINARLLALINYDMEKGAVRESEHPFSDFVGRNDSRMTTHYYEEDWRRSCFSILHEGGHCLEFQNWSEEQFANFADGIATSAVYETHSRFYENIIGRSKEFVPHFKKAAAETLDPSIASWSDEDFYHSINEVRPIMNRCDSDELTYCLHIIIRYEIERELINGNIACKDVPSLWNKKYKEYLGVEVTSDREGCMQDVHWSQGSFGYFPSYALGNMYGAQILKTIEKDIPFYELIASGDLSKILQWFKEHDYCNDWMNPEDWIKAVTGEPLNPRYYIDYLDSKF